MYICYSKECLIIVFLPTLKVKPPLRDTQNQKSNLLLDIFSSSVCTLWTLKKLIGLMWRADAMGSLFHSSTEFVPSRSSAKRRVSLCSSIALNLWAAVVTPGSRLKKSGNVSWANSRNSAVINANVHVTGKRGENKRTQTQCQLSRNCLSRRRKILSNCSLEKNLQEKLKVIIKSKSSSKLKSGKRQQRRLYQKADGSATVTLSCCT